ncbi:MULTISPECIES: toxin-antitoxin system YwqK family antitoxin [Winogradskyella]|uniref:toxin-antitoxin system YwqK family antitoxin n=1 Tax=Winogradskyella TaxID=286104 RepID=UPI0015C7047F|nr:MULTISPECIES: hypothetical protein [Winogradskyella]QXP78456.1 hypothetical protein H0I32_14740 [Winogradskyella sp. HaHa_3_26]
MKLKNSNKNIFFILLFAFSISASFAQHSETKVIDHEVYGKANLELLYYKNDVIKQKTIFTTDTIFTKGALEVGDILLYDEKGKLSAKGPFLKQNKYDFFGRLLPRQKHGEWKMFDAQEKLSGTFNFNKGKAHGVFIYYHENGRVANTGSFIDDRKAGVSETFFNNGQLHKSSNYKEGKVYNILSFFDKEGHKLNHGTLKNGNGTLKSYDLKTGKLKKTYTIIDGDYNDVDTKILKTPEGDIIEKTYKDNDESIERIERKRNDTLEGTQEFYDYKGQLKETINYTKGIKNGKHAKFNDDGLLFYEYNYVNGEKVGAFKYTPESYNTEGANPEVYVLEEGSYNNQGELMGEFTTYLQDYKKVVALGKMDSNKIIIQSGIYQDGIKTGIWKTFDSKGKLTKKVDFSDEESHVDTKKEYYKESKNLKSVTAYNTLREEGTKKMYYPNGQLKFSASYKKGNLHGEIKEYYESGQLESVSYRKEGVKSGNWKEYNEAGQIVSDDIYSGDCCFPSKRIDYYYRNEGQLSSIIIQEDKLLNPLNENESFFGTTINKDFFENGQLREFKTKKKLTYNQYSELEGLYQRYYSGGQLEAEGHYKADKKDGLWSYYNRDGKLKQKQNYNKGEALGSFEEYEYYYPSNILKESFIGVSYKEGRTSTLIRYHENGKVEKTGKYVLSKSDGPWIVYFENGTIKEEKFYERGEKKGVWKLYNEKGKVIKKTRYK